MKLLPDFSSESCLHGKASIIEGKFCPEHCLAFAPNGKKSVFSYFFLVQRLFILAFRNFNDIIITKITIISSAELRGKGGKRLFISGLFHEIECGILSLNVLYGFAIWRR